MKFFSKKNKALKELEKDNQDEKNQNDKIIETEVVSNRVIVDDSIEEKIEVENESSKENKRAIGKIDIAKVEVSEAKISLEVENVINGKSKTKKEKIVKEKSEFEEKVDKVIDSVAQLFKPFKELMLKIVPSSKGIIKLLDLFAIMIAKITKFVILRYPTFIKFLKSKSFKIIVIFLVFMFVFGAIFSKIINSNYYINSLETAIYKSTGYKAKINGMVKVSFVPNFSISLNRVSFFVEENVNTHSSQFKIIQFDAANLKIKFKFLPLLIGNFSIKSVDIIGANLDLQTSDVSSLKNTSYDKIISEVERSIKTNVSVEKINEIESKRDKSKIIVKNNDNSNVSNDSLALLNILDNLIEGKHQENKEEPKNTITTESIIKKEEIEDNKTKSDVSLEEKSDTKEQEELIEKGTPLIAPKKESEALNYSFFSSFLSKAVNNMKFSFGDVDEFLLRRGKITIVNKQGQKLLNIDNITSTLNSSLMGKIESKGTFRFADNNINYLANIDYQKEKINFDIDFSFVSKSTDIISVKGYKNNKTGDISADIFVENQGILIFINKFLIDINPKKIKNSAFNAKLLLNSNLLKIYDIKMSLNDDIYNGSFIWDFSGSARNVIIDLTAKLDDLSQISQGVNENLSKSLAKGSYFLSAVEEITNWKNAKMNMFRSNNFIVNFKVENTKLNNVIVDSLNIGFLVNSLNKVYVYDFSAKTKGYNAKLTGRLDLESKSSIIALDTSGQISTFGKTLGFQPKTIEFLQSIAKSKDNYEISTKLRLENNKMLFTDFSGNLGDMKLNDTYIIFTQRIDESDIVISTKIDELNVSDISAIYNKQISNLTYEKVEDINIFGLPDNLKVQMDIEIKKSKLRGIPFKNINLDISLFKTGFSINKFSAIGERGGSLTASISADSVVLPVIAGHINLDSLVLRFEDTKDLFFKDTNLVGNVVLNGKVKFNGQTYNNPFSNIDGDISFIKQERISINRFANIDGLFLTLTKKKDNGKDKVFVNDIYGRANIKNNIIELYPIAMLFINNNKEYRGMAQVIIDIQEGIIKGDGTGDMSSDTSNKIKFDLNGEIIAPKFNISFFKGRKTSIGVKPKKKDLSLINSKTHKKVNNLNNKKDKDNFNNTYNSNISNKSYNKLKDSLYNDMVDDNTKGKTTYPDSQNRKPSSGAVTKNKDNTTYYGNSK